jgi:hypothetical protein
MLDSVEHGSTASIFKLGSSGVKDFFEAVAGVSSDVALGTLEPSVSSFWVDNRTFSFRCWSRRDVEAVTLVKELRATLSLPADAAT